MIIKNKININKRLAYFKEALNWNTFKGTKRRKTKTPNNGVKKSFKK
jgi:hypothetical protein